MRNADGNVTRHRIGAKVLGVAVQVEAQVSADGVGSDMAEIAGGSNLAGDTPGRQYAVVVAGDHFAADGVDGQISGGAVGQNGTGDRVEPGVAADPGHHAVAADGAGLDLDTGGQGDADDHRVVAVVADGVHQVLEPALRAVQLVPDLKATVHDADCQRIAGDLGDLDPGDGLIMGDDVEPAPDNAELERADAVDVDRLRTGDGPVVLRHVVL